MYTTEEQQVDAIKSWFKENGLTAMITVVVALIALSGWRYYQKSVKLAKQADSQAYMLAVEQSEQDLSVLDKFIAEHPESQYATLTELKLAKSYIDANKIDKAIKTFEQIKTKDAMLQALVNVRLSRLYAASGDFKAAYAALDKVTDKSWQAKVAELRGDYLLEQGDSEQAQKEYIKAQQAGANRAILTKINNLN